MSSETDPSVLNTVEVEIARANDTRFGEVSYRVKSHLVNILKAGDTVLAYNLNTMVDHNLEIGNLDRLPEVIIVKKINPPSDKPKPRIKVQRIAEIDEEQDYGEFLDELENDPELQQQILTEPAEPETHIEAGNN